MKIRFSIVGLFFCFPFIGSAAGLVSISAGQESPKETVEKNSSIFSTYSEISKLKEKLSEKNGQLALIQEETQDGTQSLLSLRQDEETLQAKIQTLKEKAEALVLKPFELPQLSENATNEARQKWETERDKKGAQKKADLLVLENEIREKENELKTLQDNLETQKQTLSQKADEKEQEIEAIAEAITIINKELESQNTLFKSQLWAFQKKIFTFLILFFLWWFSQWALKKIIKGSSVNIKRKALLLRFNKIFFNSLLIILIFIVFFAQFLSFLPFLAILGTALAFALRDIIMSFIGWFVIGLKDGYRVGQYIKLGTVFGKVKEITSLFTIMEEKGYRGSSGKIFTIPNSEIFRSSLENWSKFGNHTYLLIDFLLTPQSDIEVAKNALLEVLESHFDKEKAMGALTKLKKEFGTSEKNILPEVFFEPDFRGILIRGRIFVPLNQRRYIRSLVVEAFLKTIQAHQKINLQTAWELPSA